MDGDMAATKMVIQMVSSAKEAQNISDKSPWMSGLSSPAESNGWDKRVELGDIFADSKQVHPRLRFEDAECKFILFFQGRSVSRLL
jgi:hypothetical protein